MFPKLTATELHVHRSDRFFQEEPNFLILYEFIGTIEFSESDSILMKDRIS